MTLLKIFKKINKKLIKSINLQKLKKKARKNDNNLIKMRTPQDNVLSDIKNLFRLEKDYFIKNNVLEDVQSLFEYNQDYYQSIKTRCE